MPIDNPDGPPTKEFFQPVHFGNDMSVSGAKVDSAGEVGGVILIVPQDFTALTSIEFILRPLATGASMHLDINTRYGAYDGEAYNTHSESANARDIGATVANQNLAHDFRDLVDVAALVAGDLLLTWVSYDATAIATNLHVVGVRLKYE